MRHWRGAAKPPKWHRVLHGGRVSAHGKPPGFTAAAGPASPATGTPSPPLFFSTMEPEVVAGTMEDMLTVPHGTVLDTMEDALTAQGSSAPMSGGRAPHGADDEEPAPPTPPAAEEPPAFELQLPEATEAPPATWPSHVVKLPRAPEPEEPFAAAGMALWRPTPDGAGAEMLLHTSQPGQPLHGRFGFPLSLRQQQEPDAATAVVAVLQALHIPPGAPAKAAAAALWEALAHSPVEPVVLSGTGPADKALVLMFARWPAGLDGVALPPGVQWVPVASMLGPSSQPGKAAPLYRVSVHALLGAPAFVQRLRSLDSG
jgi:hypothetical protein